jgi:EmrB/QacA subfamily drug resistance transporter
LVDAQLRNVALLVAACFFMENLDGTIVTTAAPKMGAALHVSPTSIGLVITAYLVTLAVLIPLSGWMVERYGARPVFLTAIVVFTVASLGCAAAQNLTELVAMRVLQGAGGAMMVPVGRAAVLARTEKPQLLRVMSFIVWPALLAPVIAPLLGGVITTYASWPWLFLINVPLGIVAFAFAWRLIDGGPADRQRPLDWPGVLLACTGLGGLAYTAHLLSERSVGWGSVAAVGIPAIALTAAAVWHLTHTDHPLLRLDVLRVQTFRASVGGGSLHWIVCGATPFLLPLLFQEVFGWSAIKSGLVVLFVFVGNIAIKPATTPLLQRFGFRWVIIGATALLGASMLAAAAITADTPVAVVAFVALMSGVARSVGLTGYVNVGFSEIPADRMNNANTVSATATQLAMGFGIAAAAVALRIGDALDGEHAYTIAFLILAAVAFTATAGATALHPSAGAEVTAQPARATGNG